MCVCVLHIHIHERNWGGGDWNKAMYYLIPINIPAPPSQNHAPLYIYYVFKVKFYIMLVIFKILKENFKKYLSEQRECFRTKCIKLKV